ncbi:DUF397 domain-containing protein [Streptomyces sp. NPDC090306]|uniref:DUF397 domain-containing protein n=1 Tax=Streptomyces sp. NPDC090306 TaxID=3365961 RepID=UPI00381C374A
MSTTLQWFKSSHSGSQGGDCVEVATNAPTAVHVRDSKNSASAGPVLRIRPTAWTAFLSLARD